ncbi:MAG: AMP-binding protein, partial [Fusobacterium sp. JB021]|nr:AMP-binding protein [Fusobacterium sp. JB021]
MSKNSMSIQLSEVAQRIRTLREILEISEEEMAKNTDVSVKEYQEYENGNKDFSFTFIYKCAKHLDVDPTDLIRGVSPTLSSYNLTRKGDGLTIKRRKGFEYINMAPLFKHKVAEPFYVKMPYSKEEQNKPIKLSTHNGQELDIVISGKMKMQIGEHVEVLEAGDSVYYNSSTPHGMIATDGDDAEIYAVVIKPDANEEKQQDSQEDNFDNILKSKLERKKKQLVVDPFIDVKEDENGTLTDIKIKNDDKFNFAFDIVDKLADKCPDKTAMVYVSDDFEKRDFTFKEMKEYSNMTANYFTSLGIKKGDRVMLVLKRHYQFWFSILALHKIGAIVVPATNLLVAHDFEYRFNAAGVKAIVCTADGDVANQVDIAQAK